MLCIQSTSHCLFLLLVKREQCAITIYERKKVQASLIQLEPEHRAVRARAKRVFRVRHWRWAIHFELNLSHYSSYLLTTHVFELTAKYTVDAVVFTITISGLRLWATSWERAARATQYSRYARNAGRRVLVTNAFLWCYRLYGRCRCLWWCLTREVMVCWEDVGIDVESIQQQEKKLTCEQ